MEKEKKILRKDIIYEWQDIKRVKEIKERKETRKGKECRENNKDKCKLRPIRSINNCRGHYK
jgi:hypothetical protein